MDNLSPSKIQRTALGSIIIFEMVYVLYRIFHHLYWAYYFPPESTDGLIKTPFVEAVFWDWIAVWLITLLVAVSLLRSLAKAKAWVWIFILIILIAYVVFLAWSSLLVTEIRYIETEEAVLLLPLSYGFFALWSSRKTFAIRMAHLIQLAVALAIASIVIFIDAMYFHEGVTEWKEGTPHIVYFLGDSHFAYLQERTLVLFWGCYAVVSSTVWSFSKVRIGRRVN
jgi:hypothetical protein